VKIVAVADTHNCHHSVAIPDGDIFIHAGDLTENGTERELRAAAEWIRNLPHKPKLAIAGNHDTALKGSSHSPAPWGEGRPRGALQRLHVPAQPGNRSPGASYLGSAVDSPLGNALRKKSRRRDPCRVGAHSCKSLDPHHPRSRAGKRRQHRSREGWLRRSRRGYRGTAASPSCLWTHPPRPRALPRRAYRPLERHYRQRHALGHDFRDPALRGCASLRAAV